MLRLVKLNAPKYVQVKDKIDLESGELRCPRCFGKDLAPSLPRGIVDWLMGRFGYVPRHCRFCEKRFYVAAEALEAIDRAEAEARREAYVEAARNRPAAATRTAGRKLRAKSAGPPN